MAVSPRTRIFAGNRARTLRRQLGLGQTEMARRIGISTSYLSQIETDDRPLTPAVAMGFVRAFPLDWTELDVDDGTRLLAALGEAALDPVLAELPLGDEALRRAAAQQPGLAHGFVALHAAYRHADDQLKMLDDALDSGAARGERLPWEEVRDWFHDAGNYIDPSDRASERLAAILRPDIESSLIERLRAVHDVIVGISPPEAARAPLRRYDPAERRLTIDRGLPSDSRAFHLAHQLVRLEFSEPIAAVAAEAGLRSDEARTLLSVGLANYAAGALLMPYEAFRSEARATRHDIDRLRQRFGVSFEQACHRLSTLQRPGARGVPFHFCRVDMAGNITKRHSATRMQFARFGGACPLWVVHEAVAIPDRILVQLAETPDDVRYVSMAKGLVKPSGSYSRMSRRYAVALGCEVTHAADFIYADGLDLIGESAATPIGISCRICPRETCEQRAFPPSGRHVVVDPDIREVVPYRIE